MAALIARAPGTLRFGPYVPRRLAGQRLHGLVITDPVLSADRREVHGELVKPPAKPDGPTPNLEAQTSLFPT